MNFVKKYSSELIIGIIIVVFMGVLVLFEMYIVHMMTDLPKNYRTQIMQVVDVDNDSNITLEDYEGNLFVVIGDTYKVGDCYSVLLDTCNTSDITDDIVVKTTYGGVWYTSLQIKEAIKNAYEVEYEDCLKDGFYNAKGWVK